MRQVCVGRIDDVRVGPFHRRVLEDADFNGRVNIIKIANKVLLEQLYAGEIADDFKKFLLHIYGLKAGDVKSLKKWFNRYEDKKWIEWLYMKTNEELENMIELLDEKLSSLRDKHNDLLDTLNELNLKRVVEFDSHRDSEEEGFEESDDQEETTQSSSDMLNEDVSIEEDIVD